MGNKEEILSLVKQYWNLDSSSMKKFEERLYDPYIDPVYSQYLDNDLRAKWDVPNEKLKHLDEGWKYFKSFFKVFARDKGITYDEFRDNKKLINKNYIKLGKLLKDYYVDNINDEFVQEMDLGSVFIPENDAENVISRWVDRKLEEIGRVKIPRGGIKVALSANFEDWLFCSTERSWSSCLSLSSEYMYWAGLVGLVGDKNRAMLYITDNKTKNPIKGVELDRILSRSWTLLNEDDGIFFVKFYPNEYLEKDYIESITGIPLFSNWSRYRSKYYIDFLYTESGKTLYPYQDTTAFNHRGFLIGGGKGHSFFQQGNEEPIDEDIFHHVENGLFHIIEENEGLEDYEREFITCSICGRANEFEDDFYEVNGELICDVCFEENYFVCDECGNLHSRHEMNVVETTDEVVCDLCFQEHFGECDICGEIVSYDDIREAKIDGELKEVCEHCADEKELTYCDKCSILFEEKELNADEYGNYFCGPCLKNIINKKQMKLFA